MKRALMLSAALALCASPVAAQPYRYDPGRAAFDVMLGTIIQNALRPRYQPPPVYYAPQYAPQPYVPGPVAGALPPPQQQPQSREQWKQAIVDEGQKFCDTYPKDSICHPIGPPNGR